MSFDRDDKVQNINQTSASATIPDRIIKRDIDAILRFILLEEFSFLITCAIPVAKVKIKTNGQINQVQ